MNSIRDIYTPNLLAFYAEFVLISILVK